MNNTANWPIRVGGEYADNSSLTIYRRVTAIADDFVHYMVGHKEGVPEDDFPGSLSVDTFCRMHHPEDQSPLPTLIEALMALRSFMWSEGYADQNEAMAKADAVLAAVSEHPLSGNTKTAVENEVSA